MKTLLVIRHAKSDWDNSDLHDIERPLSERGLKDAHTMGAWLKTKSIFPDKILSSPALRAFTTCRIICDSIEFDKNLIAVDQALYFGNVDDIVKMLQQQDSLVQTIFIFGHNPTFSALTNILCSAFGDEMRTCSMVAIQFNIETWTQLEKESGKLLWHQFPKKIQ